MKQGTFSGRFNSLGVMHCRERTAASAVTVFHLLWNPQDIKRHKSTNTNLDIKLLPRILYQATHTQTGSNGKGYGITGVGEMTKFKMFCPKML